MIFKRRDQLNLIQKILNFVWPQMGLKRTLIYYKHRILRLPHSTHDIAMGLASGAAVSWTPTLPFQIVQCYIFCKVTRANFLASIVGTLVGNPWTFPILFLISYMVGDFILDITNARDLIEVIIGDNTFFNEQGFTMNSFLPTLIGGYIMAVITFPLFYYGFSYLIKIGRASTNVVKARADKRRSTRKSNR